MSVETVNQFLQKVNNDAQLLQEFTQALNAENKQQAKQNVFELANKSGCQFSADELWAEIGKITNEYQAKLDSGEINEEELQAVAGGKDGNRTAAGMNLGAAVIDAGTTIADWFMGGK
jgi:predicted ribosomally synthesized peptide with nif11-like leader